MTDYRFLYLLPGLLALISTLALVGAIYQVIAGSGHHIRHDRPDVVVDAVREVVEAVRRKTLD